MFTSHPFSSNWQSAESFGLVRFVRDSPAFRRVAICPLIRLISSSVFSVQNHALNEKSHLTIEYRPEIQRIRQEGNLFRSDENTNSVIRWQNWKIYCSSHWKYRRMLLFETAKQWYLAVSSSLFSTNRVPFLLTFAPLFLFSNFSIIPRCVFFFSRFIFLFFLSFLCHSTYGEKTVYTKHSSTRKRSGNGAQSIHVF